MSENAKMKYDRKPFKIYKEKGLCAEFKTAEAKKVVGYAKQLIDFIEPIPSTEIAPLCAALLFAAREAGKIEKFNRKKLETAVESYVELIDMQTKTSIVTTAGDENDGRV